MVDITIGLSLRNRVTIVMSPLGIEGCNQLMSIDLEDWTVNKGGFTKEGGASSVVLVAKPDVTFPTVLAAIIL